MKGAVELTATKGVIGQLQEADLNRLTQASIPVYPAFNKGASVLGLSKHALT
jgi:hypothetical protein